MTEAGPTIPRAQWSTHPHYPAQVLLLGSHHNFRRISRYLVEAAEAGDELRGISGLYLRWIAGMRSHEAYEEHKLYPYLERRCSLSMAPAQAGHVALHERHDVVMAAMLTAAEGEGRRPTRMLVEALREHHEALVAHLELEEDLVIPALLELSPEQFRAYTRASIDELLG